MKFPALPAEAWIERIQGDLPRDVRSKSIVAKILLLLLEIRHMTGFTPSTIRVFKWLDKIITWPGPVADIELANIASVFPGLDDVLISSLQAYLRAVLAENAPKDTLKEHFAVTFGAVCTDVDRIALAGGNEMTIMAMITVLLEDSNDTLEDFIAKTRVPVSDEAIEEAIRSFYAARKFDVLFFGGENIIADIEGHLRSIAYENRSGEPDGYIAATVGGW